MTSVLYSTVKVFFQFSNIALQGYGIQSLTKLLNKWFQNELRRIIVSFTCFINYLHIITVYCQYFIIDYIIDYCVERLIFCQCVKYWWVGLMKIIKFSASYKKKRFGTSKKNLQVCQIQIIFQLTVRFKNIKKFYATFFRFWVVLFEKQTVGKPKIC